MGTILSRIIPFATCYQRWTNKRLFSCLECQYDAVLTSRNTRVQKVEQVGISWHRIIPAPFSAHCCQIDLIIHINRHNLNSCTRVGEKGLQNQITLRCSLSFMPFVCRDCDVSQPVWQVLSIAMVHRCCLSREGDQNALRGRSKMLFTH